MSSRSLRCGGTDAEAPGRSRVKASTSCVIDKGPQVNQLPEEALARSGYEVLTADDSAR